MRPTRGMRVALAALAVLVALILVATWQPQAGLGPQAGTTQERSEAIATQPRRDASAPSPSPSPSPAPPPAAPPAPMRTAPPAPAVATPAVTSAPRAAVPAPRAATAATPNAFDDPALLAAAREIEDVIITPKRNLDAQRIHDALEPAHFPGTLDAFALQSHHDATAMRLGDLLRAQMAVQLGEMRGRLDRLECGRSLCAMQFSFREQPARPFPMSSGISIEQRTPGAYIYRAIFSTDPRASGIVNTDGRGG